MPKERKQKKAAQTNNQMAILGQDRILPLFFLLGIWIVRSHGLKTGGKA